MKTKKNKIKGWGPLWLVYHSDSDSYVYAMTEKVLNICLSQGCDDVTGSEEHEQRALKQRKEEHAIKSNSNSAL